MLNKISTAKFLVVSLLALFVITGASVQAIGKSSTPNERLVLQAVGMLYGAEMTYGATIGNGNYGSLSALGEAQFIDPALATGYKYGYLFVIELTPFTQTTPAGFKITATPRKYPAYGRLSFYIDVAGQVHGADKNGQVATENDPIIEADILCSAEDIPTNERCTIRSLRTLHGAEMTYGATYGNGDFGSLSQLLKASLISRMLATGLLHGYAFNVTIVSQTPNLPASLKITATPQTYGTTGVRSFFIDASGVIRGADKNGLPADENDPPI